MHLKTLPHYVVRMQGNQVNLLVAIFLLSISREISQTYIEVHMQPGLRTEQKQPT